MTDFILLGSKSLSTVTTAIKLRRFLLRRKDTTNLDSILKSRDTILLTKISIVKTMGFPVIMHGCESWTILLSTEELMLLNYGGGEDSWESFGLQGDQTSQSKRKTPLNISWKDWLWGWSSSTLATWCKEPTHWKILWCWEILRAGGEGGNRGRGGWMASLTQWTWVWSSSGSWWRTGKPVMLQSMGSQRAGHDWATELIDNI